MTESSQKWIVEFSRKASGQMKRFEKEQPKVYAAATTLAKEIESAGPYRSNWSNFSRLRKDRFIPDNAYHCHIKSGKPTYVACWTIEDKKVKIVEIFYVGTHEKAPYE
jgi:hypothetical protein